VGDSSVAYTINTTTEGILGPVNYNFVLGAFSPYTKYSFIWDSLNEFSREKTHPFFLSFRLWGKRIEVREK
jgi:hypothetical protein